MIFPNLLRLVVKKISNETPKIADCLIILSSILALSNLDIELRKLIKPIIINIKKKEIIAFFLLPIKSFSFSFSLSFFISFTFL